MLALLTGFLLGSLSVLWPWKQVLETSLDRHGDTIALVQKNISPMVYEALTNNSAHLSTAILTACVGFLIVFLLDRLSIKQQ
jgi:putative membrane protein